MEGMTVDEDEVTTRPKSLKRSKPPPYDPTAIIDGSSENEKIGKVVVNDDVVADCADAGVAVSGVMETDRRNSVDRNESKVDGIAFHVSRNRDSLKGVKVDSCFGEENSHNIKTKEKEEKEEVKDDDRSDNDKSGDESGRNKKKENAAGSFLSGCIICNLDCLFFRLFVRPLIYLFNNLFIYLFIYLFID